MSTTILELFPNPNAAETTKALNALGAKFSPVGGGATIFHDILGAPLARFAHSGGRPDVDVIAAQPTPYVENLPRMDAARVMVWNSPQYNCGIQLMVGDSRVADGFANQRLEIQYKQDDPTVGINTILLHTPTTPDADGLQVQVGQEGQIMGGAIVRNGIPVTNGLMRSFNAHVERVVTVPGDLVIRGVSQSQEFPQVGFVHITDLHTGKIGTLTIPLRVTLHPKT